MMCVKPDSKQRLLDYGMTEQEIELWYALASVAGGFLDLPTLHPGERGETVYEIHKLQNRLLARPGLRAVGWPQEGSPQPPDTSG